MNGLPCSPLRATIAALFLTACAASQTASFRTFGTSCGPSNLALTARGLPSFGSTLTVEYSGPFGVGFVGPFHQIHQPFLLLGGSDTLFRGLALPWNIPTSATGGILGCQLLVAADVVVAIPLTTGPAVEYPLAIPHVPSAAGIPFFVQWLLGSTSLDTRNGSTTTTVATSNAGRAVLGH